MRYAVGLAAVAVGVLGVCARAIAAPPPAASAAPSAYFLLTFDMLGGEVNGKHWPADYAHYSVFITNPTHFTRALVSRVHKDVPGAKVLAYFDSTSIPLHLGCSTGSPMGTNPVQRPLPDDPQGYFKELRLAFNTSWTLRGLPSKESHAAPTTLCVYPGLASWVPMKASIDAIVAFHTKVTFGERGFDGLYVDMLTDDWFINTQRELTRVNGNKSFDCTGDGEADTVVTLNQQWKAWRPYLVQQLRGALGDTGVLIANTAGAMSLPGLNGVTIEMEWCGTAGVAACLAAIEGSRAVAHQPPLDIFWLTQAQQVPPPVQCASMASMVAHFHDGTVYAGSDWYDGSHIVCNTTTTNATAIGVDR